MPHAKRKLAIAALLIALTATGLWFARGMLTDQRGLDDWIGRQIVGIVNTYLVPEITFEQLTYDAPAGVTLTGVRFIAPDSTCVLEINRFSMTLAETPRFGRPIAIQNVSIERGRIHVIIDPATGDIRGLRPLVKNGPRTPFQPAGGSNHSFKLSDVLQLRRVELIDVGLHIDPGGGRPSMTLDGITTELDIDPSAGDEPGWYRLACAIGRGDLFKIDINGRINIDTLVADVKSCKLEAAVSPDTIARIPPPLQGLLKSHDATGHLSIEMSGRVPALDPMSATGRAAIDLTDFAFAMGDYRMSIASLRIEGTLSDRQAKIAKCEGRIMDGRLTAHGSADLSDAARIPAQAVWTLTDVNLQRAARNENISIAGNLTSRGDVQADLLQLPASLHGKGDARVKNGRLLVIPVLSELASAMKLDISRIGAAPLDHRADAEFTIRGDGIHVTKSEIVTTLLAARGTGRIGYDMTLDMNVNAGPLEKLQSLLGEAGNLFARLTDKLVTYHVTGTLESPQVRVDVLGIHP